MYLRFLSIQYGLVVFVDDKKAMWALAVEQKGVTEGIVKYLVGVLDQSGSQGQKQKERSRAQYIGLEEGRFRRASWRDRADRISCEIV